LSIRILISRLIDIPRVSGQKASAFDVTSCRYANSKVFVNHCADGGASSIANFIKAAARSGRRMESVIARSTPVDHEA